MFKILIASVLFLLIPQANSYEPEDFRFKRVQYNRYVKPQIKNLLSSYNKILFNLSGKEFEKEKSLTSQAEQMMAKRIDLRESCSKSSVSDKCKVVIKELVIILQKLESTKIKSAKSKFSAFLKETEMMAFKQGVIKNFKIDIFKTQKDIEELYIIYQLALIDQLADFFKPQFQGLWTNFIYPLKFNLKDKSAEVFFIKNTTIMNRAWNLFHVRMSKRGYKVEKKTLTRINIMHSRWNQILKVILKR